MADRQATIKVGIEGADEAAAAAGRVRGAWGSAASTIGKGFTAAGEAIGDAVGNMVSDLTRVATVAAGISFAESIASARQYQDTVARMSAYSGRSVDDLNAKYESLRKQKLVPEQEISGFQKALGRLTYDANGSVAAFGGLADAAVATGKSAEEMIPLGEILHNNLGVAGDTTDAIGKIATAANALGTVGGPAALIDQFTAARAVIQRLAADTPNAVGKMSAALAALGKGYTPDQASSIQNSVLSKLTSDPMGLRYFLGDKTFKSEFNEKGQLKDPLKLLQDVQRQGIARFGREGFRSKATYSFGMLAGNALANADFAAAAQAAAGPASPELASKAKQYYGSKAGQLRAADLAKAAAARNLALPLLPALTGIEGFVANHPIFGSLAGVAGGGLAGALAKGGIKAAFRGLGGLFGGGAEAAAGAAGSAGATVAGEGAGAYALSGFAKTGVELLAGGGGAMAALAALVMAGGTAAAVKVLSDIGEDKTKMGKEWRDRPEIAAIIKKEGELKAKREKPPEDILFDRQIAFSRQLQKQGVSPEDALRLVKDATANSTLPPLQIAVINQTGGPIQVVDLSKSGAAKQ